MEVLITDDMYTWTGEIYELELMNKQKQTRTVEIWIRTDEKQVKMMKYKLKLMKKTKNDEI